MEVESRFAFQKKSKSLLSLPTFLKLQSNLGCNEKKNFIKDIIIKIDILIMDENECLFKALPTKGLAHKGKKSKGGKKSK